MIEEIIDAIQAATSIPVYESFNPASFAKRDDCFLVVGLENLDVQKPILTDSTTSYPFTVIFRMTLLMPPDMTESVLLQYLEQAVLACMDTWTPRVDQVQLGKPQLLRQYRRLCMTADLSLHGMYTLTEEVTENV